MMLLEKLINKSVKVVKKDGYTRLGVLVDIDPLFIFIQNSSGKIEAIAKDAIERIEVVKSEGSD